MTPTSAARPLFPRLRSLKPRLGLMTLLVLATVPAFARQPAASAPVLPGQRTEPAKAQAESIEVVGRRESGAYEAGDAAGTKSSLPLRELPQAVRVMTRQTLDDLGATRVDDILDYVGGVSRQNNFGGLWDNIAIRGLAGNENTGMSTLLNGFAGNRGFNAPRDAAHLESVEFLKGPAAALYGSTEPGGTLNLVTKKPLWKPGAAIEAQAGSFRFGRLTLDATGPFSETVAGRLNIALENRDSFRDVIQTRRELVSPALTWRVTPSTRVEYFGEWLRHQTPLDRGVVAINDRLGDIPRERFLGEPNDGDVTIRNQTQQLVVTHDLTQDWQARLGLSHREGTLRGFSTEATALQSDNRTLRRQRRFRDYDSSDLALQGEIQGGWRLGGVQQESLVGVETFRFRLDQLLLRINPSATAPYAIDIFNPVYGQEQPTPLPNTDTRENQRNTAFYAQNVMHLASDWRLLVGVRSDRYRQTLDNRRTGASTRQTPSETSPRIGLTWLASSNVSVYANAGRSFRPNTGSNVRGEAFAPESARAVEIGAKWESDNRRLGATAALFDIRKENVLTGDPANPGFSIAAGEVRSRGAEFDLAGQLGPSLRVNASLVVNDVEVLRDNTLETGGRLLNVPRVNGSVLAMHEGGFANGQRYGIGGGFTHMGKRLGEARTAAQANAGASTFELPAYTTVKLTGYWKLNPGLRLTLDVDNLFDRTLYTSSFSRVWVTPGAARTITLGLQYRF